MKRFSSKYRRRKSTDDTIVSLLKLDVTHLCWSFARDCDYCATCYEVLSSRFGKKAQQTWTFHASVSIIEWHSEYCSASISGVIGADIKVFIALSF